MAYRDERASGTRKRRGAMPMRHNSEVRSSVLLEESGKSRSAARHCLAIPFLNSIGTSNQLVLKTTNSDADCRSPMSTSKHRPHVYVYILVRLTRHAHLYIPKGLTQANNVDSNTMRRTISHRHNVP
jgi:hypothetical protein